MMPAPPARPRQASRAVRLFRAMLALYPGEFRDEYGREMALVFADRLHAASGILDRLLIVLEAAWGVLTQAPREHAAMAVQDFHYAARGLRKDSVFAATVVVTLALGIGANTAVFQLIDAVRLRSLPVSAPEQLAEVRIAGGNPGMGITSNDYGQLTRPMWQAIAANQQAFSGIFAFAATDGRVGDLPELRRVPTLYVSGAFFDTLGVVPVHGRLLGPGDAGACPVTRAVVSHRFWQQDMGGGVWRAGQRLRLDGESLEVVGVAPPGFTGLAVGDRFDVAVPLCQPSHGLRREMFDVTVMGRLRSGWSVERASAHLDALSAGIFEATAPAGYEASGVQRFKAFRLGVYPAASGVSRWRHTYERSLWLLLGMSGLVLLMASANLANLMLARASTRDREVSIRHRVLLALIDERGHGPSRHVIEPAADQRKANRREIDDRRREVQLAEEPRLHGVLIGGADIEEMLGHQRAHMTVDHLVDRGVGARRRRSNERNPAADRHDDHRRGRPRHQPAR